MDITSSIATVAFAGLIHASFQLSISVLTLLSGHAIGANKPNHKVFRLTTSFVIGTITTTILLLSFVCLFVANMFGKNIPQILWMCACGLLLGVAISIWLFYYRREKGTSIWVPRGMAHYLSERTKQTEISAEAFGLGLTSVIGELLFIIAPLSISALVIVGLPAHWQLIAIVAYVAMSALSLLIVWALVGGGKSLANIQKWRETNKYFLQFAAGAGLIALALFIYVNIVLSSTIGLV